MAEANPYLNARREWDERYGDALARAKSWRHAAIGALAVAAIAVTGVVFIGAQSKIKPYVVAIDKMGNPVAVAQPISGGAVDQRIIEAQVANWIWNARNVRADGILTHRADSILTRGLRPTASQSGVDKSTVFAWGWLLVGGFGSLGQAAPGVAQSGLPQGLVGVKAVSRAQRAGVPVLCPNAFAPAP
ncbi:hypothetical protein THICB3180099 [Thiomonas sp. CB3]|nr:hypothetical protein THICB3180099 [Thiomonas sp. CB3]